MFWFLFNLQAGTFIQLLDGEDSDEKAVTAMGILNTLETMLNVMEASKEVWILWDATSFKYLWPCDYFIHMCQERSLAGGELNVWSNGEGAYWKMGF